MPSDDPIILVPKKRLSLLTEDWRHVWRYYSTWALAVLAVMPDIYNALLAADLLNTDDFPDYGVWAIRIVAILGIASRFIRQAKPETE